MLAWCYVFIPFIFICNMTNFSKKCFDLLTPIPGVKGVCKDRSMCLHVAVFVIPFISIYNVTVF